MKLQTERLILRYLERRDLNALVRNANNINVSRQLALVPYPYKRSDGEGFIIMENMILFRKSFQLNLLFI